MSLSVHVCVYVYHHNTDEPLNDRHFGTQITNLYRGFHYSEVIYMCPYLSGPTQVYYIVCCREVSAVRGVCYKRLHCILHVRMAGVCVNYIQEVPHLMQHMWDVDWSALQKLCV